VRVACFADIVGVDEQSDMSQVLAFCLLQDLDIVQAIHVSAPETKLCFFSHSGYLYQLQGILS
jgi:hypothetical protein